MTPPSPQDDSAQDRKINWRGILIGLAGALATAAIAAASSVYTTNRQLADQKAQASVEFLRQQRVTAYNRFLESEIQFGKDLDPVLEQLVATSLDGGLARVSPKKFDDTLNRLLVDQLRLETRWAEIQIVASRPVRAAGGSEIKITGRFVTSMGQLRPVIDNPNAPAAEYRSAVTKFVNDAPDDTATENAFKAAVRRELGDTG